MEKVLDQNRLIPIAGGIQLFNDDAEFCRFDDYLSHRLTLYGDLWSSNRFITHRLCQAGTLRLHSVGLGLTDHVGSSLDPRRENGNPSRDRVGIGGDDVSQVQLKKVQG